MILGRCWCAKLRDSPLSQGLLAGLDQSCKVDVSSTIEDSKNVDCVGFNQKCDADAPPEANHTQVGEDIVPTSAAFRKCGQAEAELLDAG